MGLMRGWMECGVDRYYTCGASRPWRRGRPGCAWGGSPMGAPPWSPSPSSAPPPSPPSAAASSIDRLIPSPPPPPPPLPHFRIDSPLADRAMRADAEEREREREGGGCARRGRSACRGGTGEREGLPASFMSFFFPVTYRFAVEFDYIKFFLIWNLNHWDKKKIIFVCEKHGT